MAAETTTEPVTGSFAFIAQLLNSAVDAIASNFLLLASALAAVSLLSMAFVDLLKALLEPREWVNRFFVRRHIRTTLSQWSDWQKKHKKDPIGVEKEMGRVEQRIANLSTGGDIPLLYLQPVEKLISHIKAVVNIALSWPGDEKATPAELKNKSPELHEIFIGDESKKNKFMLYAWSRNIDPEVLTAFIDSECKSKDDECRDYVDQLRNYISSIIDGNLGGLQIRIEYWWTVCLRLLSIAFSFAIIYGAAGRRSGEWVVFAVIGGLLAPFSHDFVSSLTKASKRA